jgi:5-dehydro-2-deoxygluconokinase
VIEKRDPWCRGVVLLGLEAPQDELEAAFAAAANANVVKGFAVGRTIFHDAAEQGWLAGEIDDEQPIADMAGIASKGQSLAGVDQEPGLPAAREKLPP